MVDFTETGVFPLQFGEFLGTLDYESARIVLLVLGDVFRFSMAATGSECPFCPIQLHTQHLFLCPNCQFRDTVPSWSSFLESFQRMDWGSFISLLFLCLQQWMRGTSFFQNKMIERINGFLEG